MRFYWVRDRVRQKQFHIYWQKGKLNRADYFTKHHPGSHHRAVRSAHLHEPNDETNYFDLLHEQEEHEEKRVSWAPGTKPPSKNSLPQIKKPVSSGEGVLKSSPAPQSVTDDGQT